MVDIRVLKRCWEIDQENFQAQTQTQAESIIVNSKIKNKMKYDGHLQELRATWTKIRDNTERLSQLLKEMDESI